MHQGGADLPTDWQSTGEAELGLPYAFASHFSPDLLQPALDIYRSRFKPSEQLDRPYAMAGINVIAADTDGFPGNHASACLRPKDAICVLDHTVPKSQKLYLQESDVVTFRAQLQGPVVSADRRFPRERPRPHLIQREERIRVHLAPRRYLPVCDDVFDRVRRNESFADRLDSSNCTGR